MLVIIGLEYMYLIILGIFLLKKVSNGGVFSYMAISGFILLLHCSNEYICALYEFYLILYNNEFRSKPLIGDIPYKSEYNWLFSPPKNVLIFELFSYDKKLAISLYDELWKMIIIYEILNLTAIH